MVPRATKVLKIKTIKYLKPDAYGRGCFHTGPSGYAGDWKSITGGSGGCVGGHPWPYASFFMFQAWESSEAARSRQVFFPMIISFCRERPQKGRNHGKKK